VRSFLYGALQRVCFLPKQAAQELARQGAARLRQRICRSHIFCQLCVVLFGLNCARTPSVQPPASAHTCAASYTSGCAARRTTQERGILHLPPSRGLIADGHQVVAAARATHPFAPGAGNASVVYGASQQSSSQHVAGRWSMPAWAAHFHLRGRTSLPNTRPGMRHITSASCNVHTRRG